ncbi:hypothetical protein WN943_003295 [Citrus x changshan-huyou]
MEKADTTIFVKHKSQDILVVQIYVDDIIFVSTNELLCKEFSSCMSKEFEMNMMGELKYFFGLQIKQNEKQIFINQVKYVKYLLKRFGYDNGTVKSTPMSTTIKLDKDEKGKEIDIKIYRGMIRSLLYLTAKGIKKGKFFEARLAALGKDYEEVGAEFGDGEHGDQGDDLCLIVNSHPSLKPEWPNPNPDPKFAIPTLDTNRLTEVGWINARVIEENVYPDLVKVFYSNMDISEEKKNRVITNVGGVLIDFDVSELNSILGTSDYGLEIFSPRKSPKISHYVHVDASIVLPRSGHLNEISHMDVVLIDFILRHRLDLSGKIELGYNSLKTSTLFLLRVMDRPLNDVVPADQLPDFSLPFQGQRRRRDPLVSASAPNVSASVSLPPEPPASNEITLK